LEKSFYFSPKVPHPLTILGPYPTIEPDGKLHDGYLLEACRFCADRCKDRVCVKSVAPKTGIAALTCPAGFSVLTFSVLDVVVRVNGVLDVGSNTSSSQFKKNHQHRKVKAETVDNWAKSLADALPLFNGHVQRAALDSVAALHDIKSVIGTLLATSEQMVWDLPGYNIEDKLANAAPQLRTIYHSCRILESLLLLTDVAANPDAATFGERRPCSIHGLIYMLQRVFEARAQQRRVSIVLRGSSFAKPYVFSSFLIIPLVLLDNAIKYADPDTDVVIEVRDYRDFVELTVTSAGPPIPEQDRERVFTRGFRGTNSTDVKGSGLGLWIAQRVATAHGTKLSYAATVGHIQATSWNSFKCRVNC
jgi:signal transduction histidine kinase